MGPSRYAPAARAMHWLTAAIVAVVIVVGVWIHYFEPADEPFKLAQTIARLKLKYVVITSVDRDDLRDGGSGHFVACIQKTRELSPDTQIEILVPDFRGRDDRALEILKAAPPDVMNHNLETVPRLYREARPGSDVESQVAADPAVLRPRDDREALHVDRGAVAAPWVERIGDHGIRLQQRAEPVLPARVRLELGWRRDRPG